VATSRPSRTGEAKEASIWRSDAGDADHNNKQKKKGDIFNEL
jgi:hypothetical protein